jgi:hypothetical protein
MNLVGLKGVERNGLLDFMIFINNLTNADIVIADLTCQFSTIRHLEAEKSCFRDQISDGMPKEVPTFADDERVLCYHGPMLYEAKVRLTELTRAIRNT